MTEKKFKERIKSQKGISAADTLIALLIILASISIMGMIYLNISTLTRITNAKSGATRIATNIIENIKGSYYLEVEENVNEIIEGNGQTVYNTKIPKGYSVKITAEPDQYDNNNLAKKIIVEVNHNGNNNYEKVSLSTVIEREIIRECNSPNFSEDYVEELVGEGNDYQFYNGLNSIVPEAKIICPVIFNGENYVLLTNTDLSDLWYSYSAKQWARVLVFDDRTDLQEHIDTNSNMVKDLEILKDDNKSFLWIPRFKIDKTVSPNKLYFMYKDTDYVIKSSEGDGIYNYIDVSDEELYSHFDENSIYFAENEGVSPGVGKWVKYYYINNLSIDTAVQALYESEYGPLFEF